MLTHSRSRHPAEPLGPDPREPEQEAHPRFPRKQRQGRGRRLLLRICTATLVGAGALFYFLFLVRSRQRARLSPILYGEDALSPTARTPNVAGGADGGMGSKRFRAIHLPWKKQAAQESLQAPLARSLPNHSDPARRPTPQGKWSMWPQPFSQLKPAAAGEKKCFEDYPFVYCEQDLQKACTRWERTLCQATCNPGCNTSFEKPLYEAAVARLEKPHLETSEMDPQGGDSSMAQCLSFRRELCPPLNMSFMNETEQRTSRKSCSAYVKKERDPRNIRFCGQREPRLNPCYTEGGLIGQPKSYCLPHFFILGEMKCGTTTLYQLLLKHPQMIPPRTKEPRFLQQGRFSETSLSRYAINFQDAVESHARDTVTFDASPVYLRSKVARFWIARWLPESKLIVLVRNPVQRSFSHWKMGYDWMTSKCGVGAVASRVARVQHLLSFRQIAERSLVHAYWERCAIVTHSQPQRPSIVFAPLKLSESLKPPDSLLPTTKGIDPISLLKGYEFGRCMLAQDPGLLVDYAAELLGMWPPEEVVRNMGEAKHDVARCSEMMLLPPGAVLKSATYAVELEKWAALFPREQIKVIVTDEMTRGAQRIMNETFDFLHLPRVDVGSKSRFCVRGKAGVMDVLHQEELEVTFGNMTDPSLQGPKLKVGDCAEEAGHAHDDKTGSDIHVIEPVVNDRLRRFFEPHNQRLYKFLGRDLGW